MLSMDLKEFCAQINTYDADDTQLNLCINLLIYRHVLKHSTAFFSFNMALQEVPPKQL